MRYVSAVLTKMTYIATGRPPPRRPVFYVRVGVLPGFASRSSSAIDTRTLRPKRVTRSRLATTNLCIVIRLRPRSLQASAIVTTSGAGRVSVVIWECIQESSCLVRGS
jgi:hypothetical protein